MHSVDDTEAEGEALTARIERLINLVMLGVTAYMLLDMLVLSDPLVKLRLAEAWARFGKLGIVERIGREAHIRRTSGRVIWEAMTIVGEAP